MFTEKQLVKLYSDHQVPDQLQTFCRYCADIGYEQLTVAEKQSVNHILGTTKQEVNNLYILDGVLTEVPTKTQVYIKRCNGWRKRQQDNNK